MLIGINKLSKDIVQVGRKVLQKPGCFEPLATQLQRRYILSESSGGCGKLIETARTQSWCKITWKGLGSEGKVIK